MSLSALSWEEDTRSDSQSCLALTTAARSKTREEQRTINIGHFFRLPLCNLPLQILQILREEMQKPNSDCHCVISRFHQFRVTNTGLPAQVQGLCAHPIQLCLI